jgi:hypothetical protein
MRAFIIITALLFSSILKGQGIDKTCIDNWIKAADSSFAVDSVKVYFVNGQYLTSFDTLELSTKLKQISPDKIACIGYSKIKDCGYQPGRGTIFVNSIKQQTFKDIKYNLTAAKKLFVDNYVSFSQHIFNDAKDPVLMIDYVMVHHSEVKDALRKLTTQEIYSVDINPFPVPATSFGQNSKNGLVQILTKKKLTK